MECKGSKNSSNINVKIEKCVKAAHEAPAQVGQTQQQQRQEKMVSYELTDITSNSNIIRDHRATTTRKWTTTPSSPPLHHRAALVTAIACI